MKRAGWRGTGDQGAVASPGTFSGAFNPAAGGGRSTFKGVVLQKQQCAVGYFLRNGASGRIEVLPKAAAE
ncbi:MAG TPA: hypothetical protein VGO11_08880 [Chthoniobacteraceae bacterium]|nr:hypothetical protein [Chthoniobacteraceae bacterium]